MSDAILYAAYLMPAARARLPFLATWHRGRKLLVSIATSVESYSVVEATCVLGSVVFAAAFIAASFGARI
jgi:hypothetical protein